MIAVSKGSDRSFGTVQWSRVDNNVIGKTTAGFKLSNIFG
jgi:hypothetical protein